MMQFFRNNLKLIFWIILIGFLIATFAYFGAGGMLVSNADTVATVNNGKISYTHFIKVYNRNIESLREQKKDAEITEEEVRQVKQSTLQELVSEEAFFQVAKDYGLNVTDSEVMAMIQQYPAFRTDNRFDHRKYFQVLAYNLKMKPQEFEESTRRRLSIEKMRYIIFMSAKVTEKEAEGEYLKRYGNFNNWAKEKEKFIETIKNEKRIRHFQQWISQLQQRIKIKENLSKFEQREQAPQP